MPNNGYFDIKRDREIIEAGGFFCQACLVGKPLDDQSPDPRYCLCCYDCLAKEAEMLDRRNRPKWAPRADKKGAKTSPLKTNKVSRDGVSIMATLESQKYKVAIIPPPARVTTVGKRGPKHKALPVELIMQWAREGMGSKRIASRLKAEHSIIVGFRTIARIISGQRVMI